MVETEAGEQVAVRVPAAAFHVDAPHELLQPPPVCEVGAGRATFIWLAGEVKSRADACVWCLKSDME